MTLQSTAEKRAFVDELIRNVRADIMAKIDDMPEDWDGHELRRYIADKFAECSFIPLTGKRLREYRNTLLTVNL